MNKTLAVIRKVTIFILKHVIPFVSLFLEDDDIPQVTNPKKPKKKWQDSKDGGQDASTEKENL